MQITLGQAAKQIGVSKPTLSKAVKSGKLSASRQEDGSYSIDPAELQRYQDANQHRFHGNGQATGEGLRLETKEPSTLTPHDNTLKLLEAEHRALLAEQEIKHLRERLDEMRQLTEKWEQQAQGWRQQAERLVLTDQRQQPERRGLFGWFRKAS